MKDRFQKKQRASMQKKAVKLAREWRGRSVAELQAVIYGSAADYKKMAAAAILRQINKEFLEQEAAEKEKPPSGGSSSG